MENNIIDNIIDHNDHNNMIRYELINYITQANRPVLDHLAAEIQALHADQERHVAEHYLHDGQFELANIYQHEANREENEANREENEAEEEDMFGNMYEGRRRGKRASLKFRPKSEKMCKKRGMKWKKSTKRCVKNKK
jgi:hypothetical protein